MRQRVVAAIEQVGRALMIRRIIIVAVTLALLSVTLGAGGLFAASQSWWPFAPNVAVLCVDDNGGTTDAPCANPTAFTTIQAAVNAAVAGDEIRVAAGSYGATTFDKSLTVRGGYAGGPGGWSTASPSNVVALNGNISINSGFTLTMGDFFTLNGLSSVNSGTLDNTGTLTKVGAGAVQFSSVFNNSGTVNVTGGTLFLGFGNSTGIFNISAGATIELCNCGHHFFLPTSTIQGAGTLRVAGSFGTGADNTISGTLALPNIVLAGGRVNIDSVGANTASTVMTLTNMGATLGGTRIISVTNTLNWSGGSMVDAGRTNILPGAALNISAGVVIAGREVNNYGTATWSGTGGISIGTGGASPGVLNNQPGATFTILNNQNLETGNSSSFNNFGTITKQSTGTTFFGRLNNSGTFDVQAGTVQLGFGDSVGTFNISAGATIELCNCGHHFFLPTSAIQGAGTLRVAGSFGTGAENTISGTLALDNITLIGGRVNIDSVGANTASTVMTLTQTGGTLGGTRAISVTNALTLSNGFMVDAGRTDVLPGAQANLGQTYLQNGRVFNNYGTTLWTGGSLDMGGVNPGTFNNHPGASFTIQNSMGVSGGSFNNLGTITKLGGGSAIFNFNSPLNNNSAVDIQAGVFNVSIGSSSGTFSIASGAILQTAGGDHTFQASSTISGAGRVIFENSTQTINGTYNVSGPTTINGAVVNFNSVGANTATAMGVLTQTNGELGGTRVISITNRLDWSNGAQRGATSTNILPGAQLNLSGSIQMQGSRTINNYGATTWIGNGALDLGSGNGQTFNNHAGATFTILGGSLGMNGGGIFNNFGTLTKQGTGTTIFSFGTTFNNNSTADVQAGTFSIGPGSSTGAFSIASGATLQLAGSNHTFQAASSISGAGRVFFANSVHTVDGAYTISGPTIMDNATVNFNSVGANTATTMGVLTQTTNAILGGTRVISITNRLTWGQAVTRDAGRTDILPGAQLNITGQYQIQGSRVVNNYGTATQSGAAILNTNPGTFNNHAGATYTTLNNNEIGGGGTFNNMGTFIKQGGTGTTQITCNFSNSGLVEVQSGTLFYIFNNTYIQTAGATRMAGGNLRFENTFQLQGGFLEGPGTITGSVNNTGGTVSPGASPGLMTITGNYTQGTGGTLNIELGGLAPVTGYDQLDVDGTATLNGTLNTSAIDGFVPQNGDSFTVLIYGSRSGTFSTIQGGTYTTNYNPNDLTLIVGGPVSTATPTPEPTATSTPTSTVTETSTSTPTPTSSSTPTSVPTSTPTDTAVPTVPPTGTPTAIATNTITTTPTNSSTATTTPTISSTITAVFTSTSTSTAIPTATRTATPIPPSATNTRTSTSTLIPTLTQTSTNTVVSTATPVSFVVTNTNDSGPGSLRQAIINANNVPGFDTITFNIPGSGVQRIAPLTALPPITDDDGVHIDGRTQPGAGGSNTPLIELDGQNTVNFGLQFVAGGVANRLTINRFVTAGIMSLAPNSVVRGCFIGTDATGTLARGNGYGVQIKGAANNFVGVTSADPRDRNVISGNLLAGVIILGNGTNLTRVQNSYIGTDLTGTISIGNGTTGAGVILEAGAGGTSVGGNVANTRNLISGNQTGVLIDAETLTNVVQGNYIGTDASGQAELSNVTGVLVRGQARVGVANAGNLISGNTIGVDLQAANGVPGSTVEGNLIGTNAVGTGAVGNGVGIRIASTSNRVGGTTTGARNIIAGNSGDGIRLEFGAASTTIQGNIIGLTAGGVALPNENGVRQFSGLFTVIGGTQTGAGNVISGNEFSGVVVVDGTSSVIGNLIGTDPTGTLPRGNGFTGIAVDGDTSVTIGSSTAGAGNVISANGAASSFGAGISVSDELANVTIQGNKIGTDPSGTLDLGNVGTGISLSSVDTEVGGTSPGQANVIAFNDRGGVTVQGFFTPATRNTIVGNRMFGNVNPQSADDLGIDLGDDGVTANDNCDPDTGANDLQNYPVLTSVITGTNAITITGSLNSTANASYSLHFYASQFCHPSGFGEGEIYLGSTSRNSGTSCDVSFTVRLPVTVPDGYFITSTATGFPDNTSEFSACLVVGQPNATPTTTRTATRTATGSVPTPTRTNTATNTSVATSTGTATLIGTNTPTRTGTPATTATGTPTLTRTSTPVLTSTLTATRTITTISTSTLTGTSTGTSTRTVTQTRTSTATVTRTSISTSTRTGTSTPAVSPTCAPNWQQVPAPNPTSNTRLKGVSITTANDVWAVGQTSLDTFVMRWNGSSWNTVSSPNPGNAGNDLNGVSADSVQHAWAVGSYRHRPPPPTCTPPFCGSPPPPTIIALTMRWDGINWINTPAASVSGDDELKAVSVRSIGDVWAVGWHDISPNIFITEKRPIAMHWNGSAWSLTNVQEPNAESELNAVDALATNDAWAVGYAGNSPLFYHWNGTSWSGQIGGQGLRSGTLYGVTAVAANDVWAVGAPLDSNPRPWVLHYDGVRWSEVTTIPAEQDQEPVQLYSVSASSSSNVWAVGKAQGRSLRYQWNGSTWTRFATPDPSPQGTRQLLGVDTIGGTNTWAVGYQRPDLREDPYVERLTGACLPPTSTPPAITSTRTATPTPDSYVVIPGTATIVPGTSDIGNHCDNCVTTVTLPFSSQLYDSRFSQVIVGSNGTLGVVRNDNPAANTCLPNTAFDYAILPHWDDLDTRSRTACNGPCGIFTSTSGAAPTRIFNIEWRATLLDGNRLVNFQVRFYERQTRIDLVYGQLDPLSSYTIGAQRDTGSFFTPISCTPGDTPGDWEVRPGMMLSLLRPDAGPTPTPAACPLQFSDVPPDHTFYTFIRCLACQGILSGYADGTFRPGNDVTRGQIAKIVSNASGFMEEVQGQTFSDVPPGHTFYEYIGRMASRGIISGYSDGTFRPQNNATRGQIAKIVANAASFSEQVSGQTFSDVPPGHTFYEYIERMAQRNIIGGYSDGTFRPQNNATRGQTAKIVANTFFPDCQTP